MRNKLMHHYMGVDIEILWDTAQLDVPVLKTEIKKIIAFIEKQ